MEADRTQPPYFPYPDREWGQSWKPAPIQVQPVEPNLVQVGTDQKIRPDISCAVIGGYSFHADVFKEHRQHVLETSGGDWTDFMRRWAENIRVRADYMDGASDI